MRNLIAFFFLVFMCLQCNAVFASINAELEGNNSSPKRVCIHTDKIEEYFASWSHKIEKAFQENNISSLVSLFFEFDQRKVDSDNEWERVAQQKGYLRFTSQNWKTAAGAEVFLRGALGVHLYPIMGILRPLTEDSVSQDKWDVAEQALTEFIGKHTYVRRRVGLYGLAASTRLFHPIAQVVLLKAMQQLPGSERANFTPYIRAIRTTFEKEKVTMQNIISSSERKINQFTHVLSKEAINIDKLEEISRFGFPHYKVLMGLHIIGSDPCSLSDDNATRAFGCFWEAGVSGDFEGPYQAAELSRALSFSGRRVTDVPYDKLLEWSFNLGNLGVYLSGSKYEQNYNLFGQLRKFLNFTSL